MDESPNTPSPPTSPFEAYPDDRAARTGRWPFIFGGLCLVYGVLGMCVQSMFLVGVFANEWTMGLAGFTVTPPPEAIKWAGGLQAVVLVLSGILLIVGAAMMLLRKPLGVTLVKAWAVSRLVMVVVGVVLAIVTLKPQAEWAVTMTGEMREQLRARGVQESQLPPLVDQAKAESDGVRNLAIMSLGFAVWPFVMALVLSRAQVKNDVAMWKSGGGQPA